MVVGICYSEDEVRARGGVDRVRGGGVGQRVDRGDLGLADVKTAGTDVEGDGWLLMGTWFHNGELVTWNRWTFQ
jgi:hypothetical protein